MKSLEEIRENVMKATFPNADELEKSSVKDFVKTIAHLSMRVAYNTFKELSE